MMDSDFQVLPQDKLKLMKLSTNLNYKTLKI